MAKEVSVWEAGTTTVTPIQAVCAMNLTDGDTEWLRFFFPSLVHDQNAQRIVGELDFCACFDNATNKIQIEGLECDDAIRGSDSVHLTMCLTNCEILLDAESLDPNGWPKVHEVGGRYKAIAEKHARWRD